MLRILYDDFDWKVKNIHDEMDLQLSYKKKRVTALHHDTLKEGFFKRSWFFKKNQYDYRRFYDFLGLLQAL